MVAGLAERIRTEGAALYHHRHPFHVAMHEGRLTPEQLRGWVADRYYYQTRTPIKDALIVAKSEDRGFRRGWTRRIVDHDSKGGGLDLWERLAEAVGLRTRNLHDPAFDPSPRSRASTVRGLDGGGIRAPRLLHGETSCVHGWMCG